VKLSGNFFAKRCAPATFCLAKKFGEIYPKRISPSIGEGKIVVSEVTSNPLNFFSFPFFLFL